jgi:hypothetical protein
MKAKTKSPKRPSTPVADMTEVLRLVNVGRHTLGMRPLRKLRKGLRGDWYECPLGVAFETPIILDGNDRSYTLVADRDKAAALSTALGVPRPTLMTCRPKMHCVSLPAPLDQFVRDFDDGLFPQFVAAEQ